MATDDAEEQRVLRAVRKYLKVDWSFQVTLEIAALLGIHPEQVEKDHKTGEIIIHKHRKRYRVHLTKKSDEGEESGENE